jgi:hypothetical protein
VVTAVAALTAGVCGGDSPTEVNNSVASIQMTATSTNPRVGEQTIIGATPVGSGGVAVQGVACVITSSDPSTLLLVPDGPGARGTGVRAGSVTVVAVCGGQGNSIVITVRPALVSFSVSAIGTGNGSIFLNPAGGSYDQGTSVTATATPNTLSSIPSTFGGWGGACAAFGTASTCTLTLTTSTTATATFNVGSSIYVGTAVPSTAMGNVTAGLGCQYAITLSGTFSAVVSANSVGTLSGTTTGSATTGITTTFSPPNTSCTSNPFTVALSGAVTGSDAAASAIGSSSNNRQRFTFAGTRTGNTMTGSLTIMTITSDGVTDFTFTKVITPYTMTRP